MYYSSYFPYKYRVEYKNVGVNRYIILKKHMKKFRKNFPEFFLIKTINKTIPIFTEFFRNFILFFPEFYFAYCSPLLHP